MFTGAAVSTPHCLGVDEGTAVAHDGWPHASEIEANCDI